MPHPPLVDSAFIPGLKHLQRCHPGQDFALCGTQGALAWGVVADGCSGGGHTELGARVWAQACGELIRKNGVCALADSEGFASRLVAEAAPWLDDLAYDDGYATVGALACGGKRAEAALFGDGVLAVLRRDGTLAFWVVSYPGDAPRYLNYERDPAALARWERMAGGRGLRLIHNEYLLEAGPRSPRGWPEAELLSTSPQTLDARASKGVRLSFDDLDNVQAFFLFTDGALSFEGRTVFEAVRLLTQVKRPTEGFARRRLAALARGMRSMRTVSAGAPLDDLAVAAIWL